MRWLDAQYRRLFAEPWARIDARRAGVPFALGSAAMLVLAALVLTFQYYIGDRPIYERLFVAHANARYFALGGFAWWSGAKVIGYLLIPLAALKLRGARLADHGLGVPNLRRTLRIYAQLFGAILPVLVVVSLLPAFRNTYPLYRDAGRSSVDLLGWEAMYAATFVSLEFFYRGFLLFALERALGAYAIFVAAIPYCMVHFGKPPLETVAAIFAGIILGTVALATRSIWSGVLIHVSVAWTMDLLSLLPAWLARAHR